MDFKEEGLMFLMAKQCPVGIHRTPLPNSRLVRGLKLPHWLSNYNNAPIIGLHVKQARGAKSAYPKKSSRNPTRDLLNSQVHNRGRDPPISLAMHAVLTWTWYIYH
jgi:hypothetical protein